MAGIGNGRGQGLGHGAARLLGPKVFAGETIGSNHWYIRLVNKIYLVVFSALLLQAANPDFSGSWKLNLGASEFAGLPAPQSVTMTVEHRDAKISVRSNTVMSGKGYDSQYQYSTGGKPSVNQIAGAPVTSRVTWHGNTLAVDAETERQGRPYRFHDEWALGAGGKTLVVIRRLESPNGTIEQRYSYDRR